MSLLMERKGVIAPPRLDGKEVLVGPNPDVAKVKGVMARLSPRTASYTKVPLASSWCEFESLVELDRATYGVLKAKYPNVLALIGAASAELGIGKVYKSLDNTELVKFLESQALFHSQYQKFGRVRFEKTPSGGRMICSDYPVYSPIYCGSAIGFYLESILRHGGNDPTVVETKCQTLGDPSCVFEMHWK